MLQPKLHNSHERHFWYKIWYDLWHNKLRTILVVLSIAIRCLPLGRPLG
jgi:hypothetical protein